ncbi:hypothetical protein [Immundisolibacter sp.]|uniref:hypothetical protein n=1 Tax=Immundisolibacter sp. TaxID=1934948 RepID=UPI00260258FD|nr:hypothetical protein [Immundisolibacter sp.]MDD3650632.1 hypothetical protein [Immundisolibacter sp.]
MTDTTVPNRPAKLQALFDDMQRIAGDDAHRPGVLEQLADVMKKAVADPEVLAYLRDATTDNPDLYGSMKDPGLGIMGVHSSKIGYREPHDHGDCWAINVQVAGNLRLVHWTQDGVDPATGKVRLRKIDEVLMGPGDVDCSPPGVAHELYPESDDSIELAVRCHSLASIIQNRYDRTCGVHIKWSWGQKKAVATGQFEVVGEAGLNALPPGEAMTARVK